MQRKFAKAGVKNTMQYTIEVDREDDGRWIAELQEIPGVMAYGASKDEAIKKAEALALRVIAEQIEHSEAAAVSFSIVLPEAA